MSLQQNNRRGFIVVLFTANNNKPAKRSKERESARALGGHHGAPGRQRAVPPLGPEPQRAVRGRGHRSRALHQRELSIRAGVDQGR